MNTQTRTAFEKTLEVARLYKLAEKEKADRAKKEAEENEAARLKYLQNILKSASNAFEKLVEENPDFKEFLEKKFEEHGIVATYSWSQALPIFWYDGTCIAIVKSDEASIAKTARQMKMPMPKLEPMKLEAAKVTQDGSSLDRHYEPSNDFSQQILEKLQRIMQEPEHTMFLAVLAHD